VESWAEQPGPIVGKRKIAGRLNKKTLVLRKIQKKTTEEEHRDKFFTKETRASRKKGAERLLNRLAWAECGRGKGKEL